METTERIDALCRYKNSAVLHLSVHTDEADMTARHVAVAMVNEGSGAEYAAEFDLEAVGEVHGAGDIAGLCCVFAVDKFNECYTAYDEESKEFYIKIRDHANDYDFEYIAELTEV